MKKSISLNFLKNLPAKEKQLTIPTILTLMRFLSVPLIVFAMVKSYWGFAFWAIIISSATDVADGYIARNFNQKTFLGACLDPIADKLLVLSVYFTLAFVQTPLFSIPLWFVVLVLIKELFLIGGAVFLLLKNGSLQVRPTLLGKMTMAVQVLFIVWLFACYFLQWLPVKTYYTALSIVLILVLSSLCQYVRISLKHMHHILASKH